MAEQLIITASWEKVDATSASPRRAPSAYLPNALGETGLEGLRKGLSSTGLEHRYRSARAFAASRGSLERGNGAGVGEHATSSVGYSWGEARNAECESIRHGPATARPSKLKRG
eukprot:10151599-Alexandrium_andersonii.AAC.1